jgi:hypothetical protein
MRDNRDGRRRPCVEHLIEVEDRSSLRNFTIGIAREHLAHKVRAIQRLMNLSN